MFFYDFWQIMGVAFWVGLGLAVFGFWLVLFSDAITWAVNYANDNESREYQWWYERLIMKSICECEWNDSCKRWVTENYKNHPGPTDETDRPFYDPKRFAYWLGTGWFFAFVYFFVGLMGGVAAYFWFLSIPILLVWFIAFYMRGVIRRKKAKASLNTDEPKEA